MEIMADLESLGTSPNSVILSIGAVKFGNNKIIDSFYERIDLQSCLDYGLEIESGTILWWLQQNEQARLEICKPGQPLNAVLTWFAEWINPTENEKINLWGNGATFDNVLLTNAYKKTKIPRPWSYSGDRCYRTVKNLYPEIQIERQGVYHNALDDAKSQAEHLMRMIKI